MSGIINSNFIRFTAGLAIGLFCALFPADLMAQSNAITGTVSDDGGPVIGAAVLVKGTSSGTVTGDDGSFSIQAAPSDTLVFDCLGYKTVEVPVLNQTVINVRLEPDSEMVEETVVVAYGVQKKSLVTGAISSVRGDALEFTGIMRADDALAGKTAGVQVVSNSGQPGSVPFLHAGEEFCGTKNGNSNSYNAGDAVNQMDWDRAENNKEMVAYTRRAIALRRKYAAFRLPSGEAVRACVHPSDREAKMCPGAGRLKAETSFPGETAGQP